MNCIYALTLLLLATATKRFRKRTTKTVAAAAATTGILMRILFKLWYLFAICFQQKQVVEERQHAPQPQRKQPVTTPQKVCKVIKIHFSLNTMKKS